MRKKSHDKKFLIYIILIVMLIAIFAIGASIYYFILLDKPSINEENDPLDNTIPEITDPVTTPENGTDDQTDTEIDEPPVTDPNSIPEENTTVPEETVPEQAVPSDPNVPTDPLGTVTEKVLPRDLFNLPLPLTVRPEEITAMTMGASTEKDDSYFTDSVFLGDSVIMGLRNYTIKKRKKDADFLSNAGFISVGSYGVYESISDVTEESVHASYKGVKMQPQDILYEMSAKKVFISFGLNDVALFSIKEHLENYTLLIRRIQMKCPDIQIIILPTTPLTIEGEKNNLFNNKIDNYNNAVIEFAKENGCYFVDISQVLKDKNGYLADNLSSDNYCHLQDEAYDLVLNYLKTHSIPNPGEEPLTEGSTPVAFKGVPEVEGWEGPAGEL